MRMGILMKLGAGVITVALLIGAGWLAAKVTTPQLGGTEQSNAPAPGFGAPKIDKNYLQGLVYTEKFKALLATEGKSSVYFSFTKSSEPLRVGKCPAEGYDPDMPCAFVDGGQIVAFDDTTSSAIVEASFNYGGTGSITTIYLLKASGGSVFISDPHPLGDRVLIDTATLKGEDLVLKMTVHGQNDGMCCPSKKSTWKLRFDGKKFVKK